jgi:hypothetical protein
VLLDACRDGEDVRIENDIFGRERDALRKQLVTALADLDAPLE